MRRIAVLSVLTLLVAGATLAQPGLTLPTSGDNQKASVTQSGRLDQEARSRQGRELNDMRGTAGSHRPPFHF